MSTGRFAEALIGGALVGYGRARAGALGALTRLAGAALVCGALAPAAVAGLVRAGAERRRVRLRTTVVVARSVPEVFAFCRDFENFPRLVQSLHRVIDYQDGRSRWEVVSSSGELLAWDSVVTKYVPTVVLAWRSLAGSPVDCRGLIRFAPAPEGTRLHVEIQYDPSHTGLGDALRALVDVSSEDQLRGDLARADFYLRAQPPLPVENGVREDRLEVGG